MNNKMVAETTPVPITINEHWLDVKHGRMRYWETTPQHGIPILFVHGYGSMIEHWQRVFQPLAQQHTVYALDLFGFGLSDTLRVSPSKTFWADQVADMICRTAPAPVVVVGHSMGGVVAAQLAHDYPDFVRGLVLVDSIGVPEVNETTSPIEYLIVSAVRTPLIGEMLSVLFSGPDAIRQSLDATYYRKDHITPELIALFHRSLRRPGGVDSYLAASRAYASLWLEFAPGDIKAPTLMLWGEHDVSLPSSTATLLQQRFFPDAPLHTIPHTGHCPFDEEPELFCNELLQWIATL